MKKITIELINEITKEQYESFIENDKTFDLTGPGIQTRILTCDLEEMIIKYRKQK